MATMKRWDMQRRLTLSSEQQKPYSSTCQMLFVAVTVAVLVLASSSSTFGQGGKEPGAECDDDFECGTLGNPAICDPLNHICRAVPCKVGGDCPDQPAICESNMCSQVECVTAENCLPLQVCGRNNKCGNPCRFDPDCSVGQACLGGICVDQPVVRQFAPIPLFFSRPVSSTGLVADIAQADDFASAGINGVITLPIPFEEGDTAVISGSQFDSSVRIVIDNFLSINDPDFSGTGCKGANACEGVPDQLFGDSCFGGFICCDDPTTPQAETNPELGVGLDIRDVLATIRPIDVTRFIPHGSQTVRFVLCDFGGIAGNTELWLHITPHP
jgi:hypothetical protein